MLLADTVNEAHESLDFHLEYSWKPFTLRGKHLNFREHMASRLYQRDCSHSGPAIYKWQGVIEDGDRTGWTGVLIGETKSLCPRIKGYTKGTGERGDKYCRETFLLRGNIYLYVMDSPRFSFKGPLFSWQMIDLSGKNIRLVLEQALIWREVSKGSTWVVNRYL